MADGGELVTRLRFALDESPLGRFINGLKGAGKQAESITHRIDVVSAGAKKSLDRMVDASRINEFNAAIKRGETNLDRFYVKIKSAPRLKHDAGSFSRYFAMSGGLNRLDPHPADRMNDIAHAGLGRINSITKIAVPDAPLSRLQSSLQRIQAQAKSVGDTLSRKLYDATGSMDKLGSSTERAKMSLSNMQPLVTGLVAFFGAMSFVHLSDEAQGITDQIKGLTGNIDEASKAQEGLYQIARNTNTAYHSAVEIFSSLTTIRDKTKLSLNDELKLTQAISQASQIGGGSTAGRQRAITQLEQAFGMNKLDSAGINSIESQARGLTVTIARGMNVSVGDLKKLAGQGKITGDVLAKAFLGQAENVSKLAKNIRPTFADMKQRAHDAAIHIYQRFDKAWSGVSGGVKLVISMINALEKAVYTSAHWIAQHFGGAEQAAKLLALAIGSIASSVLVLTIYRLASAFKALAFGVNASLWPFAAIAAAIAGLVLVGEDLYTWIEDGDSLIGRAVGPYSKWRDAINEIKAAFDEAWQSAKTLLGAQQESKLSDFKGIDVDIVKNAQAFTDTIDSLNNQPSEPPLARTFKEILKSVKEVLQSVNDLIKALNELQNGNYNSAADFAMGAEKDESWWSAAYRKSFYSSTRPKKDYDNFAKNGGSLLWYNLLSISGERNVNKGSAADDYIKKYSETSDAINNGMDRVRQLSSSGGKGMLASSPSTSQSNNSTFNMPITINGVDGAAGAASQIERAARNGVSGAMRSAPLMPTSERQP